jgi:predicted dehydrogenase
LIGSRKHCRSRNFELGQHAYQAASRHFILAGTGAPNRHNQRASAPNRQCKLARRLDLVLMENFLFLHHSQHDVVRSLVQDGEIGELRSFSSAFGIPPLDPSSFRYQRELGGGALLDLGVYTLRVAQMHLANDLQVVGACHRVDHASGVDVAGGALLSTTDGVTAQLDFGFEHAYRSDYTIWGSKGRITSCAHSRLPSTTGRPSA